MLLISLVAFAVVVRQAKEADGLDELDALGDASMVVSKTGDVWADVVEIDDSMEGDLDSLVDLETGGFRRGDKCITRGLTTSEFNGLKGRIIGPKGDRWGVQLNEEFRGKRQYSFKEKNLRKGWETYLPSFNRGFLLDKDPDEAVEVAPDPISVSLVKFKDLVCCAADGNSCGSSTAAHQKCSGAAPVVCPQGDWVPSGPIYAIGGACEATEATPPSLANKLASPEWVRDAERENKFCCAATLGECDEAVLQAGIECHGATPVECQMMSLKASGCIRKFLLTPGSEMQLKPTARTLTGKTVEEAGLTHEQRIVTLSDSYPDGNEWTVTDKDDFVMLYAETDLMPVGVLPEATESDSRSDQSDAEFSDRQNPELVRRKAQERVAQERAEQQRLQALADERAAGERGLDHGAARNAGSRPSSGWIVAPDLDPWPVGAVLELCKHSETHDRPAERAANRACGQQLAGLGRMSAEEVALLGGVVVHGEFPAYKLFGLQGNGEPGNGEVWRATDLRQNEQWRALLQANGVPVLWLNKNAEAMGRVEEALRAREAEKVKAGEGILTGDRWFLATADEDYEAFVNEPATAKDLRIFTGDIKKF